MHPAFDRAPMKFWFKYTGVRVLDLDASLRFFTEGLGMMVKDRQTIEETGGIVVDLVSGDRTHVLELNWYPPGSSFATAYEPGEALDHLCFDMGDAKLTEAIAHLERFGGKLRIAPFAEGKGRIAYVDSPDGHTIELYEKGA